MEELNSWPLKINPGLLIRVEGGGIPRLLPVWVLATLKPTTLQIHLVGWRRIWTRHLQIAWRAQTTAAKETGLLTLTLHILTTDFKKKVQVFLLLLLLLGIKWCNREYYCLTTQMFHFSAVIFLKCIYFLASSVWHDYRMIKYLEKTEHELAKTSKLKSRHYSMSKFLPHQWLTEKWISQAKPIYNKTSRLRGQLLLLISIVLLLPVVPLWCHWVIWEFPK